MEDVPIVQHVYCCGYRYDSKQRGVIIYNQPNPKQMQAYSQKPSDLFGNIFKSEKSVTSSVESKMKYHSCKKLVEPVDNLSDMDYILEEVKIYS